MNRGNIFFNVDLDKHKRYRCGHCNTHTSGVVVAMHASPFVEWLLCTDCGQGSVSNGGIIHTNYSGVISPPELSGQDVEGLSDIIKNAYKEARKSFSSGSYTACELVCRKILMNVAVDKGADEGKKFEFYVDFLEKEQYVTRSLKELATIVRKNGNFATHEIKDPSRNRAETTLNFTGQLLKSIYENDFLVEKHNENNKTSDTLDS